jgi:hypothetical protein
MCLCETLKTKILLRSNIQAYLYYTQKYFTLNIYFKRTMGIDSRFRGNDSWGHGNDRVFDGKDSRFRGSNSGGRAGSSLSANGRAA